jgi:hypothetical protein
MADDILPQTIFETEDPPPAAEAEEKVSLTEEMLRRLLDDNRDANERLIREVVAPRGQPLQQESVNPELEFFTLEGLADPREDVVAFHKGYAARAQAAVAKALQQTRQVITQDTQRMISDKDVIGNADAMIKAAIPEADDEIIAYAGGVIAKRLKAQGKDPMAAMREDTESVAQDIVDYLDDMRGRFGGSRRSGDAPAAGGRTRGLVTPRARTPNPPRQPETKEDPQSFYKELTSFQQKARIY